MLLRRSSLRKSLPWKERRQRLLQEKPNIRRKPMLLNLFKRPSRKKPKLAKLLKRLSRKRKRLLKLLNRKQS